MTFNTVKRLLALAIAISAIAPCQTRAQGWIVDNLNRPTDLVVAGRGITADIHHQVASVTVTTEFYNSSGTSIEGTFVFPLPSGATVSTFSLEIDGEQVAGEVLEAGKARQIYEDIVRKALDPALLEWADNSMFRAHVFPINPKQSRRISLRYDMVLDRTGDVVRFVLPLTGKTSARSTVVPRPWITTRDRPTRSAANTTSEGTTANETSITLAITSDADVRSVYSPTHELNIDQQGDRTDVEATAALSEIERSFVLYYSVGRDHLAATFIPHRPYSDRPGYFMLMLDPPVTRESATIQPSDILFVLDTSGSMAGEKIEQAKGAVSYALKRLGERDRFGVIAFSSDVDAFSEKLSPINAVDDALYFVDQLEARGGTNINEALTTALNLVDNTRRNTIIFLTDGLPSTGETSIERIRQNVEGANRHETRIFPFGVGYDVNTQLLDGIARSSSAFADYIAPEENLEERVSGFYERTRYPAMTDIEVSIDGVRISKAAPRDPGDIFFGNAMVLTGRYTAPGTAVINISGLVNDERVTQELRLDFPDIERESGFVARIWATRRIGELLESIRLEGESEELKDEVVALAKEFGIVTPYTSYLVREDDPRLAHTPSPIGHRMRDIPNRFDAAMQESTGREAVELSRRIAGLQQAKQATDFGGPPAASIAGQTLIQTTDGAWSTQADTSHVQPLDVQFGSEAYFLLARLYPASAEFLTLGDKVTFVFRDRLVRVGTHGRTQATEADLRSWFGG